MEKLKLTQSAINGIEDLFNRVVGADESELLCELLRAYESLAFLCQYVEHKDETTFNCATEVQTILQNYRLLLNAVFDK